MAFPLQYIGVEYVLLCNDVRSTLRRTLIEGWWIVSELFLKCLLQVRIALNQLQTSITWKFYKIPLNLWSPIAFMEHYWGKTVE